jgi:hypothetical protein
MSASPEERIRQFGGRTEHFGPKTKPNGKDEHSGAQIGRLRVLSINDLLELPERDYLVKGWLSPNEISLLVGAKNARKTFTALHVSYAVAQGRNVFGRRVKQAPILFVICEGDKGIAKRVKALVRRHGRCNAFHVIAQPIDLLRTSADRDDLHDVIEAAQTFKCAMIVVDTVSRVLAGGKENSPEDMGTLLANLDTLRHASGAHIMGVHHGTKADGTDSRGHSILPNGADAIAQVEWTGDGNGTGTISLGFARDDIAGNLGAFRTELVNLGHDADGDEITTLLLEEIDRVETTANSQPNAARMPDHQAHMLTVFRNVIAKYGEPIQPIPEMPLVTGLRRQILRDGLVSAGWFAEDLVSNDPVSGGFQGAQIQKPGPSLEHNALRGLQRRGFLAFDRSHVWLP